MGWSGYGIYNGDGTQTCHYDFIKWAKISNDDNEIANWLGIRKTKIPIVKKHLLEYNADRILKKMPKAKHWNEENAIEWQMLLSLYIDNNVSPLNPYIVKMGLEATKYLMGQHSEEFDSPCRRRQALKSFAKKIEKANRMP